MFIFYLESIFEIFRKALNEVEEAVQTNGISLNNVRYANDTAIIANNVEGYQKMDNGTYQKLSV